MRKSVPRFSRQLDHTTTRKQTQTAVVWSCFLFIRSGQKPSCKAQWKREEDKVDKGRDGTTTSENGQAWSSASPRGQWRTGKNGENCNVCLCAYNVQGSWTNNETGRFNQFHPFIATALQEHTEENWHKARTHEKVQVKSDSKGCKEYCLINQGEGGGGMFSHTYEHCCPHWCPHYWCSCVQWCQNGWYQPWTIGL